MEALVWIGAAVTVIGLGGLVWCILAAMRMRRQGLSEDQTRAALARLLPVNLGSLLLSALGLMMVAVGVLLA